MISHQKCIVFFLRAVCLLINVLFIPKTSSPQIDSFEGELDPNYGSLTSLTEIRLENNNLEGTIPAFWGFLSLEELTLFQNEGIVGPVPAELCTLVEGGRLDSFIVDCRLQCNCCTDCFDG